MMADAQTDYLNDYWTNCKTATRNLSRDWLKFYDLLNIVTFLVRFSFVIKKSFP